MNNNTFDRSSLRLSAMLLLVGQLLYVVITLLHTGGEANHHSAIFAAYAASATWTAVHVAQFGCMAIMLAGLFGLFSAVDVHAGAARLVARLGAASTTATLALYGVVLAVDGVALKQAVNAWAHSEAKREILVAPCAPLKPSHPLGGGETRCLLRLRGMGCSRRPSCGRR